MVPMFSRSPSDDAAPLTQMPLLFTEAALRSLLGALTSETYDNTTQHLEREQALAKQFAEILHFTLRFDELKVRLSIPPTFHQVSISAFKPQVYHFRC